MRVSKLLLPSNLELVLFFAFSAAALTLAVAGCGGEPPTGTSATAEELSEPSALARRAVDEAELRLDQEGGEDDDAAVLESLSSLGFGEPSAELLRADGLRALLLQTARGGPRLDAGELFQRTLDAWHGLATLPVQKRLAALGPLAGFDPKAKPVPIQPAEAAAAGAAPERGADARARRQNAWAEAQLALILSGHLDLPEAQARERLGPVLEHVRTAARQAAEAFAGTSASSARDPARAASRSLRRSLQELTLLSYPDESWNELADLLSRAVPPAPESLPPRIELLEVGGLACAAILYGLACSGTSTAGGGLRVLLDGLQVQIPVAAGESARAALLALRSALPSSLAAGLSGGESGLLRIDPARPSLEGTELESIEITPVRGGAAGELWVRGRYLRDGLRPTFFADFAGDELRVELISQPVGGAPREFSARVSLSTRLPARSWEALLTDERGRLLAAATVP